MVDFETIEKDSLDAYDKALEDADKAYEEAVKVASTIYDNALSIDLVTSYEGDAKEVYENLVKKTALACAAKDEIEKLERKRNAAWHNYNHARDYCSETWEINQTAHENYSKARDSYDNANDAYKAACGAQGIPWDEYDKGEA